MPDSFDLERFVTAQAGGVHERAVAELRGGYKRSHWMWFVFPQLRGLGRSAMASRYGLTGLAEARVYLEHPVLGPRLLECAQALTALDAAREAAEIFGSPDDVKLRSSLTLFAKASGPGSIYECLLDRYFAGAPDERTLAMLQSQDTD